MPRSDNFGFLYCSRIFCIPRGPDIHKEILAAAPQDGVSVSAWMTSAARQALQRRAGLTAVALWEKQHGRLTAQEMGEAHRRGRVVIEL